MADRFDVMTVMDRLYEAAKLGAELATALNHATSPTQPGLAAANAARSAAPQAEPQAALVRDGMNPLNGATADPAGPAAVADLRADAALEYETDVPATPSWDIE